VRLELTTRGLISIDLNLTGRRRRNQSDEFSGVFVVLEGDVASVLRKSFSFAETFFGDRDPFKRYDRIFYNAVLSAWL